MHCKNCATIGVDSLPSLFVKQVRCDMGLVNVQAMLPFVRTVEEVDLCLREMEKNGVKRGEYGLKVTARLRNYLQTL